MEQPKTLTDKARQWPVDAAIRVGFIILLAFWCFSIFRPFVILLAWSSIIAVSAYPMVMKMAGLLGGRKKLAAWIFVVIGVGLVLVPGIGLTGSVVSTGKELIDAIESGVASITKPDISVRDWPVIGEKVFAVWTEFANNISLAIANHKDQVMEVLGWLFKGLARVGIDVLITVGAVLLSGVLMQRAEWAGRMTTLLFTRLIGTDGRELTQSVRDTIRSVVKGVVLVAVIQGLLAWVGFVAIGLSSSGVWAILVMILAIMQLPSIIIMLPLIIYIFSVSPGTSAVLFAIWCIFVTLSDSFLKPVFLGKGLKIPMLVILVGCLGGMILHGIVGLFVGSVVMALGYQVFNMWLNDWEISEPETLET